VSNITNDLEVTSTVKDARLLAIEKDLTRGTRTKELGF
jgi:hypothetical protein